MKTYVLIIVNVLYYLFGKDTYKKLKSYHDLDVTIVKLAATLKKLIKVKTDDESVIDGRNEYLTQYKWFKGHLFDLISYKYVILNENFKSIAINDEKFRLLSFDLKTDFIKDFIIQKFDLKSVGIEVDKLDLKENDLMTAIQWNAFWNEVLDSSSKDKTLENLSSQYLLLSQLPGVIGNAQIIEDQTAFSIKAMELGNNKKLSDDDKKKELNKLLKDIPSFCDFRNETEFPAEFILTCCPKSEKLCELSPSMIELTDTNVNALYDIHSYLFSDI